jgi:peptide-methionine (R)-S-oxide reductase
MPKVMRPKQEWQKILSPDVFHVTREKGTEPPFSGKYDLFFEDGIYYCANCRSPLFLSDNKFDSGCGWPSFDRPAAKEAVAYQQDLSGGINRVEVTCTNCGAHLGHVFPDGPKETTGQRYCINSLALDFQPKDD